MAGVLAGVLRERFAAGCTGVVPEAEGASACLRLLGIAFSGRGTRLAFYDAAVVRPESFARRSVGCVRRAVAFDSNGVGA